MEKPNGTYSLSRGQISLDFNDAFTPFVKENVLSLLEDKSSQFILVPEDMWTEMKLNGMGTMDLVSYDKLKRYFPEETLKKFMLLNSLGYHSVGNIDGDAKEEVKNSVPTLRNLTPLLGDVTDVRTLWLLSTQDKETQYEIVSSFVEQTHDHEDSTYYDSSTYLFEVSNLLQELSQGINNNVTNLTDIFDKVSSNQDGQLLVVPVPLAKEGMVASDETVYIYAKEVLKAVLRKANMYQNEQQLSKGRIFTLYLSTVKID